MATPSKLAPYVWPQVDANGNPYSGALLYTYLNDATTPWATYTSPEGTTSNANPIVFNTLGEPSNGTNIVEVCIPNTVTMTFILKTSTGATIGTWPDLRGINDFDPANIAEWYTTTYTGTSVLTYIAPTQFSVVTASDQTSVFHVGRRIKIFDGVANHYGTITTSTSSGGGLLQTITCTDMDAVLSGAFSGTPALYYGILSSTNPAIPKVVLPNGTTATTQTAGTSDTTLATTAFVTTAASSITIPTIQDFRLTLESGVPVSTADQTAKTTLYFTPYKGKKIGLYNGVAWELITSAEMSIAIGAAMPSVYPYDVFVYNNSGTATLEVLAWTNTANRATNIEYFEGVLVKTGTNTRRYVGTVYPKTANQLEDSVANRNVWNYYNRVRRQLKLEIATVSWTYTTATWRQANNSTANQFGWVTGVIEDTVELHSNSSGNNASAGAGWSSAIGLNSVAAPASFTSSAANDVASGKTKSTAVSISIMPALGVNYAAMLEYSIATGTTTWYGTSAPYYSGMHGSNMC